MSTATKAATMEPDSVTTIVSAGGLSTVATAILFKLYNMYFSARTEAATSQATMSILSEIREENSALRAENNRLRSENSILMKDKYDFESSLKIATESIRRMTAEMDNMRTEMASLQQTIREMRDERRT